MIDGPPALSGADPASAAPLAAPPDAPAGEGSAGLPPDIAWLFRRSLAQGRMHPLLPLLLRYRHGAAAPPAEAGAAP